MKLRGTDWSLSLEQHSSTADCSLSVRHTLPHHLMHLLAKYEALLFSWYHVYFHTQVQHVAPLLSTVARLHAVLPHSAHQGVAQCELLRRGMEQMRLQPPAPAASEWSLKPSFTPQIMQLERTKPCLMYPIQYMNAGHKSSH